NRWTSVLVAGVVGLIAVSLMVAVVSTRSVSDAVHIDAPSPPVEALVGTDLEVRGTAPDVPIVAEPELWTVVALPGYYWPQRPVERRGEQWVGHALIGAGPEDEGKTVQVLIVEARGSSAAAFRHWLQE